MPAAQATERRDHAPVPNLMPPMIKAARSALVVVDVQARLAPHVHGAESIERRCLALVEGAQALQVPVFLTEHCPEALGKTLEPIRARVGESQIIAKRHFSAMSEPALPAALRACGRDQVLLAGMESHVCVMQTALGLMAAGYECWFCADALGSRRTEDRQLAIDRLREAGARAASVEMVLFEWLQTADHPALRRILELVKDY